MLGEIRKIIAKYNFPPELIGKIENAACDIYDLIFKERQRLDKFSDDINLINSKIIRMDRVRSPFSQSIKDNQPGYKVFVSFSDFGGYDFYAHAHNVCKSHSKITIHKVKDCWIVTKIKKYYA